VNDGEKSGESREKTEDFSARKNGTQENASGNTAEMKKDEKETVPSEAAETDEETSNENVKSELSEEDRAIYREESDMRKAERRVRESRDTAGNPDSEKVTETENNTQSEEASAGGTTYIIRPGDTLYQISVEKYGSMEAVAEICRVNNMSESETIYPGQIIVLP
ncbi:MAG: LysM peptidoglycan-binding domain-containing protein, partial [Anaerobutyricum soehngenii]